MKTLHSVDELSSVPGPIVLAIGVFDGVHLGHCAVIERALADARSLDGTAVVVTFHPHPVRVLRPDDAPRLLTSTPHKERLIAALGVRHLLVIQFDERFAGTLPADFIRRLAEACRPLREICVGHQWSFGKGRTGNLDLLKALGDELGFDEVGVHAVRVEGEIVSSTLIRQAVEAGDLQLAAKLLGRPYTILGTVVKGDGVGRTLGFPTANLSAHNEQYPPDGVYAAEAEWRGQQLCGVVNIGVRPTITKAVGPRLLEAHLFDFSEDIYGEEIELTFRRRLRDERHFSGLEALRAQIERDIQAAKCIFAEKEEEPLPPRTRQAGRKTFQT